MATKLKREDPVLFDGLVALGAEAAQDCIELHKHWSSQRGISRSRATRQINGDPHSPFTGFLVDLCEAGNPWPMLNQGISVVIQHSIRFRTLEWLYARLEELNELEHDAEAEENRQMMRVAGSMTPEQLEIAAKANVREANISLERSSVLREIARKLRKQS